MGFCYGVLVLGLGQPPKPRTKSAIGKRPCAGVGRGSVINNCSDWDK